MKLFFLNKITSEYCSMFINNFLAIRIFSFNNFLSFIHFKMIGYQITGIRHTGNHLIFHINSIKKIFFT